MKSFFKLREELDSCCDECADDTLYGSVEEDFEPTGEEQYEDWDSVDEGLKSKLAGAALAATMAMGASHARVGMDHDPNINRLTGKPHVTQSIEKPSAEKSSGEELSHNYVDKVDRHDEHTATIHHNGQQYKAHIVPVDSPRMRGGKTVKVAHAQMGFRGLGHYDAQIHPSGHAVIFAKKAVSEETQISEKGPGLWANIHAKRQRIKAGSGERMREPGSKGAPTASALKRAAESVDEATTPLQFILKNPGKEYPPFDPDPPKKNPGFVKGKKSFSGLARHLAKTAMNKAATVKEEIDLDEAKDTEMYKYIDQSGGQVIKGKSGTYVGYTHSATKGKGANILKHNQTKKYYAAGGSSTAFTQKTTLHDTPEDAARAYHKGNLAEAIKKPNATTRHLRDYPVSDKDMAKPITYYSLVHKATNKILSTHKDLESAKDEHRGMDQGERAHYRIAASTKAPKSFSMKEDAAEGLNEMDKSAPQPGRDGKISHSTYGSRDKEGSDYFKGKEVPVKPITVKKMEKDALDILKKQGVAEASSLAQQAAIAIAMKKAGKKPKNVSEENLEEAEKGGRKVQLNKPFRTSDGKGKFAVYTKNEKGNVVKVNFGDTTGLTIKTSNPDRRRSFRARHNCDNPGPKHKARYWSCRAWSRGTVSAGLGT